jgi:hypothetical protein
MEHRYINASDVPRLLGKEYRFFWTTDNDISRIIFGKKIQNDLTLAIENIPEETLSKLVPGVEPTKKRKLFEESVINNKKQITRSDTHSEYVTQENEFVSQLPVEIREVVKKEFTMERGNVEESRIIKDYNIPKTNKLEYLTFKVEGSKYKIGSRFDGPQIEIKTRKNKFMGVPDYEKVQMHIYMATSGFNEWTLKEKFNDQVIDHEIFFDNVFFEKIKMDIHKNWEYHLKK